MKLSQFSTAPFPKDLAIGSGTSIESRAVERFFRDKTIGDISLAALRAGYSHDPAACLVFMTNEAFAFFLPAFLRISLDEYDAADAIPGAVINRLVEMAEGHDNGRRDAVMRSYTREQLGAIADFLEEMSDRYWHLYPEDSARRALRYWKHPIT